MVRRKRSTNEEFVVVWQGASSLADAARAAGMTPRAASLRASYMRGRGIDLKRFVDTGPRLDVAGLAVLARQHG